MKFTIAIAIEFEAVDFDSYIAQAELKLQCNDLYTKRIELEVNELFSNVFCFVFTSISTPISTPFAP
jgi:hypothetical protein